MRISEGDPVAIQQTEVEAEDDLAVAVALGLAGPAHFLKALSLHVLGHEHAPGRQVRVHPRHAHERMPPHQPLDRPLILGLELVIELLGDPLSHLGGERLGVQSGREPLDERQ